MSTRVTHTACGQPVLLTDDNRLQQPDGQPHQCPGPDGPWTVITTGRRWSLQYVLDPEKTQPTYDTRVDAQHEANQRNAAYERARAPKPPQPQQAALPLNLQEVAQ